MIQLPKHKNRKEIPEYHIWKAMRARCNAPSNKDTTYQKNGISICEEWNDFITFYSDMGQRPTSKHSIDRIDNSLGYSKSNCRWAVQQVQCENRGTFNRVYFHNGEYKVLKQIARDSGINYVTLLQRLDGQCLTLEEAIAKPNAKAQFEINGRFENLKTWCNEFNISHTAVATHLSRNKQKTFLEVLKHYGVNIEDIVCSA